MSDSFRKKMNGLSPAERLRVTDKYISELRGVLMQMDEIAALRRSNGEPVTDEVGGYKRSSVERMLGELEKQKESILSEMSAGGKAPESRQSAGPASTVVRPESAPQKEGAVAGFMHGDNALAIESVYTGLSMDIEKMRDDILQEMKYTYKQDMAIYDDLAEKIEAIRRPDLTEWEEKFAPLLTLAEKLDQLQPLDYDALAERVAERLSPMPGDVLSAMEGKLEEMQHTLSGAVSVRQLPEFRRLDSAIEDYKESLSYDYIPDILKAADSAKNTANRYIAGGNTLRGEAMLFELGQRLESVEVWGTSALAAADDAVRTNKLPMTYSEEAYKAFFDACAALEQAPALVDDELAGRAVRAKNALFADTARREKDREILAEMAAMRVVQGEDALTEEEVEKSASLKKGLMTFDLSYFIDLSPAVAEAPASPAADTEAILNAIRSMTAQSAPQTVPVSAERERPLPAAEEKSAVYVKKPRTLRPAVSAKDNKTEPTDQPLRVVRRSIKLTDDNPDALSKKLVADLAQRIAASRRR